MKIDPYYQRQTVDGFNTIVINLQTGWTGT